MPITLTLPGIAGLILTIGVAADANIVIFERVKEELRAGKSVPAAIATGYREGPDGDHRRERRDGDDGVHPLHARDRRREGLRLHARRRHARLAVHGRDGDAGDTRDARRAAASSRTRRRSARTSQRRRWTLRLHGRVEVVLLDVRRDPADRRARDRRQGPQLRHRLHVRHAHHDALAQPDDEASVRSRARRASASATRRSSASRTRSSAPTSCRSRPSSCSRPRCRDCETRLDQELRRHVELLQLVGRPDVRRDGREQRDHRDHRVAAGDLGLHRAALPVEVRRAGADRA